MDQSECFAQDSCDTILLSNACVRSVQEARMLTDDDKQQREKSVRATSGAV